MENKSKEAIAKRLKVALKQHGMKAKRFAVYLGVSETVMSNYLRAITDIPAEIAVKASKVLNVELAWILTGEGQVGGWEQDINQNIRGFGNAFAYGIEERLKALEAKHKEQDEWCRVLLDRIAKLEGRFEERC